MTSDLTSPSFNNKQTCLSASKPKYTFDFSEEEDDEGDEEVGGDNVASSPVRTFKEQDSAPDGEGYDEDSSLAGQKNT